MVNSFLASGFKNSTTTFNASYVYRPDWSIKF